MSTRQEKMLSCIDLANQLGIEIGALNRPIVTREMGNIRYVDHATTKELKEKYAADSNVDVEAIVDVNYVWGVQTLPELVGNEAPFDYVIASHVIEHVPDFIGWLKEIHAVLKPGGILSLAIPDKRYCFDYRRHLTQPAETIEAFLEGRRKPSPRQIFDHFASCVSHNGAITWVGAVQESELTHIYSNEQAFNLVKHSLVDTNYVDAHCWVFTPNSFFKLISILINLDLFDFKFVEFFDTSGCEFYVTLEALDLTKDESERHQIQLESLPSIALENSAPVDHSSLLTVELEKEREQARLMQHKLEKLREHSKLMQNRLEKLRANKQRLRKKVQNLQADLESCGRETAAMQSSKFWQLREQWMRLKQSFLKGTN